MLATEFGLCVSSARPAAHDFKSKIHYVDQLDAFVKPPHRSDFLYNGRRKSGVLLNGTLVYFNVVIYRRYG